MLISDANIQFQSRVAVYNIQTEIRASDQRYLCASPKYVKFNRRFFFHALYIYMDNLKLPTLFPNLFAIFKNAYLDTNSDKHGIYIEEILLIFLHHVHIERILVRRLKLFIVFHIEISHPIKARRILGCERSVCLRCVVLLTVKIVAVVWNQSDTENERTIQMGVGTCVYLTTPYRWSHDVMSGPCFSAQCTWNSDSESLGFRFARTVTRVRFAVDIVDACKTQSRRAKTISVSWTDTLVMLLYVVQS